MIDTDKKSIECLLQIIWWRTCFANEKDILSLFS